MEQFILKNGLRVVLDRRPSNTTVTMLTVHVGSNNEGELNNGISHFIEHSVFNGTRRRKALDITNAIEALGGEINAATSPERTFFFTKTLPKHIPIALDILSDIAFCPTFEEAQLITEKQVVGEEIDFIYDDFNFYQWVVFQEQLFKGPQRLPVYGSKENITRLSKKDVLGFHNRNYVPNNMVLTIAGSVPLAARWMIKKHFSDAKPGELRSGRFKEPKQKKVEYSIKLPTQSSYMVLGYQMPPRGHEGAIITDLICGILGRGQSGTLFNEIRNKLGLAYSVGAHHSLGTHYNFFGLYANLQEKNIPRVKKIFLDELKQLAKITEAQLEETKGYVEGDFFVGNDDNLSWATQISAWELAGDAKMYKDYLRRLRRMTLAEFKRGVKKYIHGNYCCTMLLPQG